MFLLEKQQNSCCLCRYSEEDANEALLITGGIGGIESALDYLCSRSAMDIIPTTATVTSAQKPAPPVSNPQEVFPKKTESKSNLKDSSSSKRSKLLESGGSQTDDPDYEDLDIIDEDSIPQAAPVVSLFYNFHRTFTEALL
jgi:hypothetical protein